MEILDLSQPQDGRDGIGTVATDSAEPLAAEVEPVPTIRVPLEVPGALEIPESRRRRKAALGGVVVGVLASLTIFLVSPEGSSLHRLFDLRTLEGVIPLAILVMFSWGALLCLFRWKRLRALEAVCRRSTAVVAARVVQTRGAAGLLEDLARPGAAASPLHRRLRAAAEQWMVGPDLASVDTVLAQHAAYDEEDVHAGFSLLRTFVWALPVLGLIGTVIGISVAVGGFAQFLGGDIDDVSVIKTNLVNVTAGLSYAFLITLIGLGTSLVLMLVTSGLQTREEGVYSVLQQSIAEAFLPVLQRQGPISGRRNPMELEAWGEALRELGRAALVETGRFGEAILNGLAARDRAYHEQMVRSMNELRDQALAAAETMVGGAQEAGERLQSSAAGVLATFAALDSSLVQSRQQLVEQTAAQATGLTVLREGVVAASESWTEASKGIAEVAGRFETHVQQLIEPQVSLTRALCAFDVAALRATIEQHDSVSARHADALDRAARTMAGVVDVTQSAIAAHADLARALTGLLQPGLLSALAALPDSVRDLTPVLRSFREPFVLQAVPVAIRPVAGSQDGGSGAHA